MTTFFDMQEQNRKRTRIIIVCFVLFFLWLGAGLDLALYFWSGNSSKIGFVPERYRHSISSSTINGVTLSGNKEKKFRPIFTCIVGLAGMGFVWWSMSNASETVLDAMRAKPADKRRSQEEQTLLNVVEEMCIASTMKQPKVWIIPDQDPNAMAVGLSEDDYHIAVTEGLLRVLNRDELQGVVAHELAHLRNQDTRMMTTLTILVGFAALISEFVNHTRIDAKGSSSDDNKIGTIIYVIWLLTLLIAPLATKLMALMVSREREYLADASAAQFTRNPEALAKALEKIASSTAPTTLVRPASAHLCIASPDSTDLSYDAEDSWFATHPPIKSRIYRLMKIGKTKQMARVVLS